MRRLFLALVILGLQIGGAQSQEPHIKSDSSNPESMRLAADSLQQLTDTLQRLLHIVQNTGTDLKAHADRVREFMRLGTREREERLAYHINRLQPANETMKKDLLQQFRFIMQSLALYRSDLRKADFKPTESSEEELIYLRKKLPELIESLKNLASLRKATD